MKKLLKKYDRDIRFFINTVALGLLFLAFLKAFAPYLGRPDPQQAEINAMMRSVIITDAKNVPPMLRRADGRPVMLVIYASWCPYCKELLPDVAELIQHHKLGDIAPLVVSVDERKDFLAIYLVHHGYVSVFTPYMVDASDLTRSLKKAGSGFTGGIPFVGFYDAQGKPMAEYYGLISKYQLLAAAQKLASK